MFGKGGFGVEWSERGKSGAAMLDLLLLLPRPMSEQLTSHISAALGHGEREGAMPGQKIDIGVDGPGLLVRSWRLILDVVRTVQYINTLFRELLETHSS